MYIRSVAARCCLTGDVALTFRSALRDADLKIGATKLDKWQDMNKPQLTAGKA
jgi:hypothetical protein